MPRRYPRASTGGRHDPSRRQRDEHRPGLGPRTAGLLGRLDPQALPRARFRPVRRHRVRRPHGHRARRRHRADAAGSQPPPRDALGLAGAPIGSRLPEDRRALGGLRGRRAEGPRGLGDARPVEHLRHHRQLRGSQPGARGAPDRDGAEGPPGGARPRARPADGAPPRRQRRRGAHRAGDDAQCLPGAARHVRDRRARRGRRDHAVGAPVAARPRRHRRRRRRSARRCASASSSTWASTWPTPTSRWTASRWR